MVLQKNGSLTHILLLLCLLPIALSGCVMQEENRGYVKALSTNIERIKIGVTGKNDVQYLLGSPSSASSFGKDTWYYIGLKLEKSAYHRPQVTDQDIIIVSFDKHGVVEDVTRKGDEDRRDIAISQDATATEGNDLSLIEQLLGNLGRYNGPE